MAVQQPIAVAFNRSLVGRTLDVLIDAPGAGREEPLAGPDLRRRPRRRRRDAACTGRELRPGDLVACEIVERRGLRPDRPAARRRRAAAADGGPGPGRGRSRRRRSTILDGMP